MSSPVFALTLLERRSDVRPFVQLVSLRAGDKRFTAKWKKVNGVTGYQLQYSLKKSMKNAKSVKVTNYKKISRKITGLKSKKTYYVRVRTYRKVNGSFYYSKWTSVKKVKTK